MSSHNRLGVPSQRRSKSASVAVPGQGSNTTRSGGTSPRARKKSAAVLNRRGRRGACASGLGGAVGAAGRVAVGMGEV